ncbi:MAG: M1 family peptidase, partial [Saprospiraceae bacterium]
MTSKKRTINCLIFLSVAVFFLLQVLNAQTYRWQMAVRYKMNVDFFVEKNQYRAIQALTIINNSPDTLNEIFYHLYFNAFQPGSDMDIKSLLIEDPDPRVGSRISRLKEDEMGYIKPGKISQKGKKLDFEIEGTIMKVNLQNPILPHDSSIITMKYSAQVPLQIRRTGRNNKEGVDYSMAQWYPKLCNYDEQGWHTDPYIGREFYAPWGDYDVQIRIAGNYIVAAT